MLMETGLYIIQLPEPDRIFHCEFCKEEHPRGAYATMHHKLLVICMLVEAVFQGWPAGEEPALKELAEIHQIGSGPGFAGVQIDHACGILDHDDS